MAADNDSSYELFEDFSRPSAPEPQPPAEDNVFEDEPPRETVFKPQRRTGETASRAEHLGVRDAGEGMTFGEYLREMRQQNTLSIDDLADETKIRTEYLRALEAEDFDNLPPLVYVLAYVKKLCIFYQVSEARIEELTADLREQLTPEPPEDINKSIIDREEDPLEAKRLKVLTIIWGAAAAGVVILLVAAVILIWAAVRQPESREAGPEFDSARLTDIQGQPVLSVTKLAVPR